MNFYKGLWGIPLPSSRPCCCWRGWSDLQYAGVEFAICHCATALHPQIAVSHLLIKIRHTLSSLFRLIQKNTHVAHRFLWGHYTDWPPSCDCRVKQSQTTLLFSSSRSILGVHSFGWLHGSIFDSLNIPEWCLNCDLLSPPQLRLCSGALNPRQKCERWKERTENKGGKSGSREKDSSGGRSRNIQRGWGNKEQVRWTVC